MIIFKKANDLRSYIKQLDLPGTSIGFLPTMGALHEGHLSLLREAQLTCPVTICSIFVNPTQFNNAEDFNRYPVTLEKDIEKLIEAGCSILFLPSVEEIYPEDFIAKHYELDYLEKILEGFYRPGHFQGVCQVVDRLIDIVDPGKLYLGQKDFQQCMVIKRLLEVTGRDSIELVIIPTLREKDGLAMSSRNLRLSGEERQLATTIYEQLIFIKQNHHTLSFDELKEKVCAVLTEKGFTVDYVEIAEVSTLLPAHEVVVPLVALIAASINGIRLIDNMLLN